jgi:hypothetical protein
MRTVGLLALVVSITFILAAQEPSVDKAGFPEVQYGAQTYRDPHSGIIFYVESDARHIPAISRTGKLLWTRDPFNDAHLEVYGTKHPQIAHIGPEPTVIVRGQGNPRDFVQLAYNSSQFGLLRKSDGKFIFEEQN